MYSFNCLADDELDVKREDELRDSPLREQHTQGFEHPASLNLPARIDLFDVPELRSTYQGDANSQLYSNYSCNMDDGFPSPLHPLRASFLAVELDFMLGITGEDVDSDISIKVEKPDLDLVAAGVKRRPEDVEDTFVPVKSEENDAPISRESLAPSPGAWTRAQGRVSQQKRLRLTVEHEARVPGRVVADAILNHLERQETLYEAASSDTSSVIAPIISYAHLPTPPPERQPHSRATVTESSPKLDSDVLRRTRATCRGQKPPRYHIWKRYD